MNRRNNIFSLRQYLKIILFTILLPFLGSPAFAQSSDSPASSGGYEITIPLGDNDYQLDNRDSEILISFRKPLETRLEDFSRIMPQFISAQTLSDDKASLYLTTGQPLTVKAVLKEQNLILNIMPKESGNAQIPEVNPIDITFGEHPDFYRFVFKYTIPPIYSVKSENLNTMVYFLSNVRLDFSKLKTYPGYTKIRQTRNATGGTDVTFPAPLIKASEYDGKIVLDIAKNMDAANSLSINRDLQNTPPDSSAIIKELPKETAIAPLEGPLPPATVNDKEIISLSFPWNSQASVAVFRRESYLWIVFDHRQKLEKEELAKNVAPLVDEILFIPHTKATIIRLKPKPGVKAAIRKEGLLWIVDLSVSGLKERIRDMNVFTQYDSLKRPYFYIPTTTAGNIILVVDPEVGDNLVVAPTSDIGSGLNNAYTYPDFDFLNSIQGLAMVPKNTDILVDRGNTGIIVKGGNKGLNISDDLEQKKRQQELLQQSVNEEEFDVKLSAQLLNQKFNSAVEQLNQEIEKAPEEHKQQAQMELAKYFLSQGLGTNALTVLKRIAAQPGYTPNEQMEALFGVANFLTRRYSQAIDNFAFGKLPNNNEATFWRTLASAAKEYKKENNVILLSFISLIKDYPDTLKAKIALVGADTAINAGDDLSAQNFIDVLHSLDSKDPYFLAKVEFLEARRRVLQGYPRNAIKLFKHLAASPSQKYSAFARYEGTILDQKLGSLPLNKALANLEQLRFAWGEPEFKLNLLRTLAELYRRKGDYLNALNKLNQTLPLQDQEGKQRTLSQMIGLLEDVFVNNQADNLSPLKSLAIYHDYEWLIPQSKKYNRIIQKLADRLVSVDLLPRAFALLQSQLQHASLTPEEKSKVGTRLALINLFEGKNLEALQFLDSTESPNISTTLAAQRRIIRAKTLSNIGRDQDAVDLLKDDYSKNALLLKSEIYWNSGKWSEASDTIRYLIDNPKPGEKLSDEQIGYILDWATALNKAGRKTVLVRLRNKFLPYFKDTKYYSPFSILTGTLERDTIDLKAINQTINDITAFSNFTKLYNDALKNSDLGGSDEQTDEQ